MFNPAYSPTDSKRGPPKTRDTWPFDQVVDRGHQRLDCSRLSRSSLRARYSPWKGAIVGRRGIRGSLRCGRRPVRGGVRRGDTRSSLRCAECRLKPKLDTACWQVSKGVSIFPASRRRPWRWPLGRPSGTRRACPGAWLPCPTLRQLLRPVLETRSADVRPFQRAANPTTRRRTVRSRAGLPSPGGWWRRRHTWAG